MGRAGFSQAQAQAHDMAIQIVPLTTVELLKREALNTSLKLRKLSLYHLYFTLYLSNRHKILTYFLHYIFFLNSYQLATFALTSLSNLNEIIILPLNKLKRQFYLIKFLKNTKIIIIKCL